MARILSFRETFFQSLLINFEQINKFQLMILINFCYLWFKEHIHEVW